MRRPRWQVQAFVIDRVTGEVQGAFVASLHRSRKRAELHAERLLDSFAPGMCRVAITALSGDAKTSNGVEIVAVCS